MKELYVRVLIGDAPHETSRLADLRKGSKELTATKRNVAKVGVIGTKRLSKCAKKNVVETTLFHDLLSYSVDSMLITEHMIHRFEAIDKKLHNQDFGLKIISVMSDSIMFDIRHTKTKQTWHCIVHKCDDEIRVIQ